jgi:hypothetical protein
MESTAMGQGGYITFVNGTPYDWNKTNQHSYQMNSWDFPQVITAGSSTNVYVEWDQNIFHTTSDDSGEVNYTFGPNSSQFQIQASASNGFMLRANYVNLATQGNPVGSSFNLGWNHDGNVNFILSGRQGNFHSSNPPAPIWMQSNLSTLGALNLRGLCMPGSHDAGMSQMNGSTAFGYACNTQTQTQSILGQLISGSRYFDIRPVISAGQYFTGHYSYIDQISSWQGANGQSIASVISDVNSFTASSAELVILYLSHDLDTDAGNSNYPPFNQDQWNGLLTQLKGLNALFVSSATDLSLLTLSDYIGQGKAAVLVIVDPSNPISLGSFANNGFFPASSFPLYNSYSDSNDLNTMSADQIAKMKQQRPNPQSQPFLLSWTLTQNSTQASTCFLGTASSILDLANTADPALPSRVWPAISKQTFPNVLYIDNMVSTNTLALAMAVNDLTTNQ